MSNAKRRKILLVDDEDDFRASVAMVLQAEGWEVREARHGAEALHVLQDWDPSVMMLDWRMPVMDGGEVLRRLENYALRPRVVLVTASPQVQALAARHQLQFHISKPFEIERLIEILEDAHRAA